MYAKHEKYVALKKTNTQTRPGKGAMQRGGMQRNREVVEEKKRVRKLESCPAWCSLRLAKDLGHVHVTVHLDRK